MYAELRGRIVGTHNPQVTDQAEIVYLDVRRRGRLGGILHEYEHVA